MIRGARTHLILTTRRYALSLRLNPGQIRSSQLLVDFFFRIVRNFDRNLMAHKPNYQNF